MYNFEAILFDLDGTLVDSSAVVERIWAIWCREQGVDLASVLAICHGARTGDTIAAVAPHLDAARESALLEAVEAETTEGLVPVAGAVELLAEIPAERWGIVTSGTTAIALPRLSVCGITPPEVFVTAEKVSQGKPHPEPYLTGAAALGVAPARTLVFEDAPLGIRSALDAGCSVVAIGSAPTVEHERLIGVIPDLSAVQVAVSGTEICVSF